MRNRKVISLNNIDINKNDLFELLNSIQSNQINEVNKQLEKIIINNSVGGELISS